MGFSWFDCCCTGECSSTNLCVFLLGSIHPLVWSLTSRATASKWPKLKMTLSGCQTWSNWEETIFFARDWSEWPWYLPNQSVNEDLWHSLQESFTVPFTRMFILLSDLEPRCSDAAVATIMQGIVRNLRGIKHIPQLDMKVTVTVVNKRGAHAPCLVCLTLCTYISAMCTMPGHSDIVKELGTLWCPLVI